LSGGFPPPVTQRRSLRPLVRREAPAAAEPVQRKHPIVAVRRHDCVTAPFDLELQFTIVYGRQRVNCRNAPHLLQTGQHP